MSRMMPSQSSFFFFKIPETNQKSRNCQISPSKSSRCSNRNTNTQLHISSLSRTTNSNHTINKHRKENLLEHGLEHWRTRRKQRRGNKGRGENGVQSTFNLPFKNFSNQLWAFFIYFLMVCTVATSANQLDVHAQTRRVSGPIGSNVSLTCISSVKPVLCLWKTPYGHVYTLSEGVFAESGRIRHKKLPQGSTNDKQCGIEIIGVEDRDAGQWECEVGAVTGEDFKTATANINLVLKAEPSKSKQFEPGEVTSRQEVGNDVILHCSANREVHLCRWKTPYLNTYIVGEGIYVERGRIQWLGSDPNYDCTIRVANLDLRDSGTWVCEIGSSTKESFQVQTKEFVIDIEKPLKLSAPTSLMQNANTDATLVCHANKPFDDCLWTTPYGKTYSFKPNDPSVSHENGRLAYFGFADTDCGVIVHNVQARDNGGWLCQLHSHNGGGIFQNATDIVPLFADSAATRLGAAQPRSISDYDYDKSISFGDSRNKDKDDDYDDDDSDFSGRVGTPAIDTFDYDNIDFDKVNKDIRKTTATSFNNGFTSTKRPKIVGQIRIDRVRPGSDQGAFTKIVGTPPAPTTSKQSRFRNSNAAPTSTSTEPSIRGSTLHDIFITSDGLPMLELSKIAPTSSTAEKTTTGFGRGRNEETSPAHPLSIFGRKPPNSSDKDLRLAGVDPLELELLSRISGTHNGRDTRPIRIDNRDKTEQEMLQNARFESSKTTTSSFHKQASSKDPPEEPRKRMKVSNVNSGFTFATEKNPFRSTTPSSETREEMRLREIQRIRDERRRKAMERQKEAKENIRRVEQKRNEEKPRKDQENVFIRESEIARQKEKKRKEEIARRAEVARRKETKRREELARKAEKEREAEIARRAEIDRQAAIERQEKISREKERERQEELARQDEKRRKEEKSRQDAISRRKQKERQEEAARKEQKRRREEISRQKQIRRQKEIERIEEIRRKEELERKKEKEKQEDLDREAKLEEEQKKKQEEELAKLAELIRQEELSEKRRLEEAFRREAEKEEKRLRELRAKQEKERKRKAEEERLKRLEEEERKRKLQAARKKKAEDERLRRIEEQERKQKIEAEKKQKVEEERLRGIEEEERKKKLEAERRKKQEEERLQRLEEEERKRKFDAERKRKHEERRKSEQKRRKEAERKRKQEERKRTEEKEKKEKEEIERLEEERQKKIREEEEKKKLEDDRKRKEEDFKRRLERERKRKEDASRRRAEVERRRQDARDKRQKEVERLKKEEEERLKKEIEQKRKDDEEKTRKEIEKRRKEEKDKKAEDDRIRKEMQEKRRKEKEDNERDAAAKKEEEQRKRLQGRRDREQRERRRKEEAERQRKIEEERQKILDEQKEKERLKKEQEESQFKRREEDRQRALGRIREERLKLLQQKQDAEKVNRELSKQVEQERSEFELKRKAFEADRERRIQGEIRQKAELEKQQRREELERRRQQEREPTKEINRASLIPRTESPRAVLQSLPTTDVGDTKCYISPYPTNGNITCNGDLTIDEEYIVSSGRSCILKCRQGFVSLSSREARCMTSGRLIGRWSRRLECVRPDAMIIIGGRNSNGVVSSVELVTGRGVCRGAVPPLPAMRWKMIAHTIDEDRVLACGGTNIFGEPKSDCWVLGFRGRTPFWTPGPDMLLARDSAAWALEGDYLFIMGGSRGKLKGSTNEVEMYQVPTGRWVEGPNMSSRRHGHCAVGLGNGSLVVTGGYGGLEVAERLDVATGHWTQLAELSPVRAQHGCALVELYGEQGIMVVGGDSGGTRLRDVRFLPLNGPSQEWRKVADLKTARWGRPGVAIVGGRITVAGGWDGVTDLDTVEYYDESDKNWKKTASRLGTSRRWLASSPISIRLFPKCAQRRE